MDGVFNIWHAGITPDSGSIRVPLKVVIRRLLPEALLHRCLHQLYESLCDEHY